MSAHPHSHKFVSTMRYASILAVNVLVLFLMLFVIEGAASYVLLLSNALQQVNHVHEKHAKYDPELGWVQKPNLRIPNMYGSGKHLTTNDHGFRNTNDFTVVKSKDKIRIICSGDSLTLGHGVGQEHTWCNLLPSLGSKLETINMGMAGYGVDQSYLWFRRDGVKFQHDIHILAFIIEDFYRMQRKTYLGFGRPMLEIASSGGLLLTNVPVPKTAYSFPQLMHTVKSLRRLHTVELLTSFPWRSESPIRGDDSTDKNKSADQNKHTKLVLRKIFEELKTSSKLVLVHFPTLGEAMGYNHYTHDWIKFIESESKALAIPLISPSGVLQGMSPTEVGGLYFDHLHLNERGNELMARIIHEGLRRSNILAGGE